MSGITIVGEGFTGIATALNLNNKKIKLYEALNRLKGILRDHTNLNDIFSYNFSKLISRVRSARYFAYSVRDYKLIKYYQDNSDIDNLIFTNFLKYRRKEKAKSILDQLNSYRELNRYE